jgi:hypothetical protein
MTIMADSPHIIPPSKPRHYIIVVHGMGEQKLNETVPPVVQRFAEVRQNRKEQFYDIMLPASLSSQSVRSDSELHGWSEFRGIPVDDKQSFEDFDGTPPTDTAGENFRFVELYWQDILQRHQSKFASKTEVWSKALLDRLNDPGITPQEWLPAWALPMLRSIIEVAVPLKNMLAFKYAPQVDSIFNGFLGDVHLYGDYARTRGEAVRLFHAALDKIMFYDFLDWRIRELTVSRINHEVVVPGFYEKPKITIIAHSLGSIMSFDALVYAFAKKEIRQSHSESIEFDSSFPFFGYAEPSPEEKDCWKKHDLKLKKFIKDTEKQITDHVIDEIRINSYKKVFDRLYDEFTGKDFIEEQKRALLEKLNCNLGGGFPATRWYIDRKMDTEEKGEPSTSSVLHVEYSLDIEIKKKLSINPHSYSDSQQFIERIKEKFHDDFHIIKSFLQHEDLIDTALIDEISRLIDLELIDDKKIKILFEKIVTLKGGYWKNFLSGFPEKGKNEIRLFKTASHDQPPEINDDITSSTPPLLWRNCVDNFITLGSPIDKYVALWHQNYIHLGLKIKDYTTPARWFNHLECQYDFSGSNGNRKIKHYNFCDEQDPVGHNLDLTRKTEVYPHIFEMRDVSMRDIVFRRYGFPGLAHTMYWKDGDLFRGILREVVDRKEEGSSTYFKNDEFRDKKNARKQGFLWAYFRVPFFAALVTGGILTYALNNIFNKELFKGSLFLVLLILLWIRPAFLKFYKKRTDVANVEKHFVVILFNNAFTSGIFPKLLKAAVEWRRILVVQSVGENIEGKPDSATHLALQKPYDKFIWWEFVWRWSLRLLIAITPFLVYVLTQNLAETPSLFKKYLLLVQNQNNMLIGNIVFFIIAFLVAYIIIMAYIFVLFFKTKNMLKLKHKPLD